MSKLDDGAVISRIGVTTYRPGSRIGDQLFGIRRPDRRYHLYVIGKTGTGKSTLLRNLFTQDIAAGEGCALFDPHGDLVESVASLVPPSRQADLIYLNTPSSTSTWHFNPLAGIPPPQQPLAVAGMVETFRRIWPDDWGPRLEHLLRNVLFTLLQVPEATLADMSPLLTDKDIRARALSFVSNEEVLAFWQTEFARYSPAFRAVVVAPLQNKIGAFLTDPAVRRVVSAPKSSFDVRQVMDEGKILLVNLSKGEIGEGPASLLGSLLVSAIALAGLSRSDTPEERRRDFYLYLDEFHSFSTLTLATMAAELRKYRVSLTLAHQYLGQLDPRVADAVLGNVGTTICFRLGSKDARRFADEFSPVFEADDFLTLPNYHCYLRLMIDGEPSRPFSARSLGQSR